MDTSVMAVRPIRLEVLGTIVGMTNVRMIMTYARSVSGGRDTAMR